MLRAISLLPSLPDSEDSTCSTCIDLGRECYECYISRLRSSNRDDDNDDSDDSTNTNGDSLNSLPTLLPNVQLSISKLYFIECLLTRLPNESIAKLARRAKITPATAYNYLSDPNVIAEYRARVQVDLGTHRHQAATSLIKGAVVPGKGQAAMQRIYWQLLGDLKERQEISGPNGGPVQVDQYTWFDNLPVEKKVKILEIVEGEV